MNLPGINADEVKSVREIVEYIPETGLFIWKVRRAMKLPGDISGDPAKTKGKRYGHITVLGRLYPLHRLAWAMHYGELPSGLEIDHINRDGFDNRIENLRVTDRSGNCHNRVGWAHAKSGFQGVSSVPLIGGGSTWRAKIQIAKVRTDLGYFPTPEAAHQAYLEAKRRLHPGCTI